MREEVSEGRVGVSEVVKVEVRVEVRGLETRPVRRAWLAALVTREYRQKCRRWRGCIGRLWWRRTGGGRRGSGV